MMAEPVQPAYQLRGGQCVWYSKDADCANC